LGSGGKKGPLPSATSAKSGSIAGKKEDKGKRVSG
jgi:hypothetical protein